MFGPLSESNRTDHARRPPRLWTVLLLSNLAVLALPLAGLWALRLYESALLRQTESELVAQAAVLASDFRERLHIPSEASAPGTPPQPSAAALHMARHPGLDFALDPILPPEPEAASAPPADPIAAAAGRALTSVLRDAQLVTLASLRITDAQGVIVASTGDDVGRSLAGWDEVARVLAGAPIVSSMHARDPAKPGPTSLSRTSRLRVFVALLVADPAGHVAGAVVLSRTPAEIGQIIHGKRRELLGLALLLFAGGTALAAGISRLVTAPLGRVVAQARSVAGGGTVAVLARPGTREVGELSAAIAGMARTLERRADYIGSFAASVSHEFKTPLAAIRAAAELLDDHADTLSAEERRHLLSLVSDGVGRLTQLVSRLVELARADMMRAGLPGTSAAGVAKVLDGIAARYRDRNVAITIAGDPGPVALPMDALDALFTALAENAAVHAPGPLHIRVNRDADQTQLEFRDDGPGVPPAHRQHIFEPFFTTARQTGSTGLGLPIVKAIAASVGGDVSLGQSGPGATFIVRLPSLARIG